MTRAKDFNPMRIYHNPQLLSDFCKNNNVGDTWIHTVRICTEINGELATFETNGKKHHVYIFVYANVPHSGNWVDATWQDLNINADTFSEALKLFYRALRLYGTCATRDEVEEIINQETWSHRQPDSKVTIPFSHADIKYVSSLA